AVDAGVFGEVIPIWRRQLNDAWMNRYRGWVYGAGYGWQLGVGVATYIMTAAGFAVPVLGVLSGDPGTALVLRLVVGWGRGCVGRSGPRVDRPAQLGALPRRFADRGPAVRLAVIAVELAVVVAVLAAQWSLAGVGVALGAVAVLAGVELSGGRSLTRA